MDEVLQRLIQAREKAGLSRSQVARKLHVSITSVALWETEGIWTVGTLKTLCELYDVSFDWLMTGTNPNFDAQRIADALQGINPATLQEVLNSLEPLFWEGEDKQ